MTIMKNSNVKWIGEIPSDWKTAKVSYLCDKIFAGGTPDTTKLEFWDGNIPWLPSGSCKNKCINSYEKTITDLGYRNSSTKSIPKNTTLIAMTGATCSNVGYTTFETCANQSVTAFVTKEDSLFSKYLFYSLIALRDEILSYQMGGAQAGINVQDCKNIIITLPPLEVQKSIANFLDKKCSEIDSLSADIQSQIDVLEEYKKSVITQAVTKGLNPDVEMKDSGIKWIGMIPKHWDLKPLKYSFTITSGSTPDSTIQDFWDGDVLWITPADFKTDDYYTSGGRRNISKLGYQSCSTNMIPSNSIIFSKRAPIGSVVINSVPLCTNQGCLACIPNTKLNVKFYYFVMSVYDEIFNLFGSGTTFKEISATIFGNMHFAEPTLEEQQEIVDFLNTKCAEIDAVIVDKKAQLGTLAEYKKSLIYEYVTGKKEVE